MIFFFRKFARLFFTNFLILLIFILFVELVFGYWFDKDNFGPYMREHRMKNQPTIVNYNGEIFTYNFRRNYYGFRGDDIDPTKIEAIIVGGSAIEERYKPDEFTITENLNKKLRENNYKLKIINGGIEAQSTVGIIYNFKHWFSKIENFSPKLILFYIGLNDSNIEENLEDNDIYQSKYGEYGGMLSSDVKKVFYDNIKSRSFLYDSVRIFKFKYLPRKNFVMYENYIDSNFENNFHFVTYEDAINKYDLKLLKKKYEKRISKYLSRVDLLYEKSRNLNANPVFITSTSSEGNTKNNFIFNYSLISHCKKKNYNCINLAKTLNGKFNYWRDGNHTTIHGSKIISDLIFKDLIVVLKNLNLS